MKVQVNFNIYLRKGEINADALDKWLSLLEGYFSIHIFFDKENITFSLLKAIPHVKNWWENYCEHKLIEESEMFEVDPTWKWINDAKPSITISTTHIQ